MSAVVLVGEAGRQEVVVVPVGVLADGRTLWRLGTVNIGDGSRVIRPAVPAEAQGLVTSTGHVYRFVGWSDGWPLGIQTAEDYQGEVAP